VKYVLIALLFFILGGAAGYFYSADKHSNAIEKSQVGTELHKGQRAFTNQLLACKLPTEINKSSIPTKNRVIDYIQSAKKRHLLEEASFYFKDLTSGSWYAYNEDAVYIPASLLKVPVMITLLKQASIHPKLLEKKILYGMDEKDNNQTQNIKPRLPLEHGKEYTINELIERMIIFSDNNALALLSPELDKHMYEDTFRDVALKTPPPIRDLATISVKQLVTFITILYDDSYLDTAMSNKALDILTRSDFKGMAKVLPRSLLVAHKFGELQTDVGKIQLHDCGIVYYPHHPYLLCIMTRGENFDNLENVIGTISTIVYKSKKNHN
jgi:beta-lactamase class A